MGHSDADYDALFAAPIFFEPNRVSRTYTGGKLLAAMRGLEEEDGNRPEEWIASTVAAYVEDRSGRPEGLSLIEGRPGLTLLELARSRGGELFGPGGELGLLVKFIDSSIRLAVQVHPDKAFARSHFASPSGKTEMWIVLAARPGADLRIGLKEGVTREAFSAAMDASELEGEALAELLNQVPARPGDAWLIPGRLAHAIGAGCLILELQEPTDFVFRPEVWAGARRLTEFQRFAGLGREAALDCFDFDGPSGVAALEQALQKPRLIEGLGEGCSGEVIIDRDHFPEFGARRFRLDEGRRLELRERPSILVATAGAGRLTWAGGERPISRGDYFLLPYAAGATSIASDGGLELIECLPPLAAGARKVP